MRLQEPTGLHYTTPEEASIQSTITGRVIQPRFNSYTEDYNCGLLSIDYGLNTNIFQLHECILVNPLMLCR